MVTAYYQSPIGCLEIKGSKKGIKSICLKKDLDCAAKKIPTEIALAVQQLDEYFSKKEPSLIWIWICRMAPILTNLCGGSC